MTQPTRFDAELMRAATREIHPPDTLEDLRDRLEDAASSLSGLMAEAQALSHGPEVERLTAKREGVWLALSYCEEALKAKARRAEEEA